MTESEGRFSEETLRRSRKALDRLIRRAHGPRTARSEWDTFDAIEDADEQRDIWRGGGGR